MEGVRGRADNNAMLQTLQTKVNFDIRVGRDVDPVLAPKNRIRGSVLITKRDFIFLMDEYFR